MPKKSELRNDDDDDDDDDGGGGGDNDDDDKPVSQKSELRDLMTAMTILGKAVTM